MRPPRILAWLPVLGAVALAGCDAADVTDPFSEQALAEEDQIALSLLGDPATAETAMALVDVPLAGTMGRGMGMGMRSGALQDATDARLRFEEARRAMLQGDSAGAAQLAREARGLVARATLAAGGRGTAGAMVERMRGLALAVGRTSDEYVDAQGLMGELNRLAERARLGLHRGDSLGAAQRGVLAEQRHRQRQRDAVVHPGGPAIAVELAEASVALATDILAEAGATEEQNAFLAVATEYATTARATLDSGVWQRVGLFGMLAQWEALRAVVGSDGISDEEAQVILALAQELYAEAAALEEVTEVQAALLARAAGLIEGGSAALAEASPHGTPMLWRAAVICSWILS